MLDFICMVFAELLSTSEKFKMILYACAGNQTVTPCFPACPSNHSAIGAVDDLWLKFLQYLFTLRYYKNSMKSAKGYIENKNKKLLTYSFVIDTI